MRAAVYIALIVLIVGGTIYRIQIDRVDCGGKGGQWVRTHYSGYFCARVEEIK